MLPWHDLHERLQRTYHITSRNATWKPPSADLTFTTTIIGTPATRWRNGVGGTKSRSGPIYRCAVTNGPTDRSAAHNLWPNSRGFWAAAWPDHSREGSQRRDRGKYGARGIGHMNCGSCRLCRACQQEPAFRHGLKSCGQISPLSRYLSMASATMAGVIFA